MSLDQLKKHYGYLSNTGTRVIVVFRSLPADPKHALVVSLDSLPDVWRDEVLNACNSPSGQNTVDFYSALQNRSFSDGSNILNGLHVRGFLKKVEVNQVIMTPLTGQKVPLAMINSQIDKTPYVDESLAVAVPAEVTPVDPKVVAEGLLLEARLLEDQVEAKRAEAYALCPDLRPGRGRPQLSAEDKERITEERKEKRKARDQELQEKAKAEKKALAAKARLDKKILRDATKVAVNLNVE